MKKILGKYFQFCSKTGKLTGVKPITGVSRLLFPLIGLTALVWILIRVIPKPSRLSYPCMKTAMPLASGFIGYLAMVALSAVAFLRSKKSIRHYPIFLMGAFAVFGISGSYLVIDNAKQTAQQFATAAVDPNQPIGVAKGIFPGRVVWVHNPEATNKNCVPDSIGHAWFMSENMNQMAVVNMLSAALHSVTGQTSDSAAWAAIFQYHNAARGKGAVNYVKGEKIFIKINATSSWSGNFKTSDLTPVPNQYYGVSETSLASVLAVLRQLVKVVGVAQSDIYIGDPLKHIYKHLYDAWHTEFPNVHYLDYSGYTNLGREKVIASTTAKITYSDNGSILRTSTGAVVNNDYLYTIFENAEYVLNIPMMKGHQRAGMTMFAKNHFGSHTRGDASHLHNGLVRPDGANATRTGYGLYRVQVDLMGHKLLSGKNLIYIMDALWATDYELDKPRKWKMQPFNNDYMSSIFVSFDPVAIESVGYDFLRSEFTAESGADASVQMPGVDDYLHQAADSTQWPIGIKYDPDNTGVPLASLGTHEHWNNAADKQYSRNLGTGNGIELIVTEQTTSVNIAHRDNYPVEYFQIYPNYPNPFNPSTTIVYALSQTSSVEVAIYDLQGRKIRSFVFSGQPAGYQKVVWDGTNDQGSPISSGTYVYRIKGTSLEDRKTFDKSAKMILLK